MVDYDFLILSPNEFENISRDLLQKKLSIYIESFTSGRDGGIDLRYSTDKDKSVIVQAKRYKSFRELLSSLKKEVNKVKKISPSRYVITTSVGLSPDNKKIIQDLFTPYIKSTEDIFGRDELNNLLGLYGGIEKQYYKLWLASINVLEKVLHSRVCNQSAFELDEIKEQVKLYVQNDSLTKALDVLDKNKYLIISGIPGIGKTTLARVIVLYLLSNDYDEFVFLNQSIDDGYELFNDEKSQVFLFDDFLGSNFLERRHLPNEDNKIVKFIEKIKKSHNKQIIFTTREYILNQAKSKFEAFAINNIEIAKCVLDLTSYTKIIKAQILYNHLFFAKVPMDYITNIIDKRSYLKLIEHRNYNPRIIETVIKQRAWEFCQPNQFMNYLMKLFNNPESVWLHAYENNINQLSQSSLLVLLTMGTPVLLTDWEKATREFYKINNPTSMGLFDSIKFNKVIKQLEGTFIETQMDSSNKIAINYQNPSIQDFLTNYLRGKDDLIESLLNAIIFGNQFLNIFRTDINGSSHYNKHKILLNEELVVIGIKNILTKYSKLTNSKITKLNYNDTSISWYKSPDNFYSFLHDILIEFGAKNLQLKEYIYEVFQEKIYFKNNTYTEQTAYINLLSKLDLNKLTFDKKKILDNFIQHFGWVDRIDLISKFENIFPDVYKETIESSDFKIKIETFIKDEVDNVNDSDASTLNDELSIIKSKYGVNLSEEVEKLNQKQLAYDEYLDEELEKSFKSPVIEPNISPNLDENDIIEDIFNSLLIQ